jgi:type I restriction enzyme S subunit
MADVARLSRRLEPVTPGVEYRLLGVKWWGQGAYHYDTKRGDGIAANSVVRVQAGDLIINKIWVRHGSSAIVPDELDGYYASTEFPTFELDASRVSGGWLKYLFLTRDFWLACDLESRGSSGKNRIKPEKYLTIPIPLPPLEEQRRIVAKLDQITARVEEAKKLRREAVEEAVALIDSATSQLLGSSASQNWPVSPLGELGDIRSGVTLGRQLVGSTVRLPYLRVANVQAGRLDLTSVKEVTVLESERTKWSLQHGDLLMTEGGDWDKLGRCAVWREEIPCCIHQNHIFRVRLPADIVVPEFAAAYVGSLAGRGYFQAASKKTTNLASINQRQLRAFPLPVPSLSEQRRVLNELAVLTATVVRLKKLHLETEGELGAVLPALLDKAFKGEL